MGYNYFSRTFFLTVVLGVFFFLSSNFGYGTVITSVASGDWNDPNTWDCSCVPTIADYVVIDHTIAISADVSVFDVIMNGGTLQYNGFTITYANTISSKQSGNFNDPDTWYCNCIPDNLAPIIVNAGDTVKLVSANTIVHAITVLASGVLDNMGKKLTIGSRTTINGEYTGIGLTYLSSGSTLDGIGIISTLGDWQLYAYGITIVSGANLTVTNSNFIVGNTSGNCTLRCLGNLTLIDGSITVAQSNNYLWNESTGLITLINGNINIISISKVYNYGKITVGGNVTGSSASLSKWYNYATGTLNIGGTLLSTGILYNYSGNTINYNGSENQTIKRTSYTGSSLAADNYYHLQCSNSGTKTLAANTIINGDLTIRDATQLDVSPDAGTTNYNLGLKGNWYDSSSVTDPFIERNGTVTFSGDTVQKIISSELPDGETFYNLVINNSDTGVVLTGANINVSDTLTLTDGLLHTGADTVWVTNTDSSSLIAYSDTSYVNGYLKRNISPTTDSNYDFPVGNAGAYSLTNIKFFGSNAVGDLTVDFSNSSGGTTLTSLTDGNDAVFDNLLNCGGNAIGTGNANAGIWNIRPGKGSAIYDLSLYGRHFDNAGTMYQSIVKRSSNLLPWEFAGTFLPAELKTDTLIARRTCLTNFYQFAIATSNTSGSLNTTPISFSSPDSMICGSKCIDFISKNNFSATNWRWTLSGGAFASAPDTVLQNPSGICFNDLGKYDVRLIASTACKAADTLEKKLYIKVNPIPLAAIAGPVSVCSGASLSLSASPAGNTYQWSTGESSTSINHSLHSNTTYSLVVSTPFCSDTAYSTIAVTTTPTASINADTTAICSADSVRLTASGIADAYLWNTGETGTILTVAPLTTETYTLTLSNGICSDKEVLTVKVTTTPTATITTTGETSICSGKRILLSAASAIPDVTYLWNNATTSQSINAIPLTNTTYSVVLSNGNCKDTAAIDINVTTTPTLILTANRSIICSGESVALSATGAGDYLWSTGESGTSITASPLLPIHYSLSAVRYSLKLSNGSCFDNDSLLITVVPMPTASISGSLTVCSGNSTSLTAMGGSTYLWSIGVTSADINITPLINTTYSVSVSNGNGLCVDTTSRNITLIKPIPANAGPDITMAIGLDTVLSANNGSAWSWYPKVRLDCSTCQNPIVSPFQTTSYTVTVTDINGCLSSDSVKVYVIPCAELFVPKAFSPNNDGQNDVLYIRGTDCIDKVNAFIIFNRWGEKVFETFDIKAGWDGSQTKETLPNEVFIYYLDALSINGDAISKTGNVTLLK